MTCKECKYHSYVSGVHFCDSRNHKRRTVRIDDKEALKDIDCKWAERKEQDADNYKTYDCTNEGSEE